MTRNEAIQRITTGKFVSILFVKRTTGELRKMLCRTGVKKHLQGGTMKYNPREHGLLTVFDMIKREYRSVPVEGLQRVMVRGQWYQVK